MEWKAYCFRGETLFRIFKKWIYSYELSINKSSKPIFLFVFQRKQIKSCLIDLCFRIGFHKQPALHAP